MSQVVKHVRIDMNTTFTLRSGEFRSTPDLLDDTPCLRLLYRVGKPDAVEAVEIRLVFSHVDELIVFGLVGVDNHHAVKTYRTTERVGQAHTATLQCFQKNSLSLGRVLQSFGQDNDTAIALVKGAVQLDRTRIVGVDASHHGKVFR